MNGDAKQVRVVRLDRKLLERLHHFAVSDEPFVQRIMSIIDHHSSGTGFFIEYGGSVELHDDDRYDYKEKVRRLLADARLYRELFGFCAFRERREPTHDADADTNAEVAASRRRIEQTLGSAADRSRRTVLPAVQQTLEVARRDVPPDSSDESTEPYTAPLTSIEDILASFHEVQIVDVYDGQFMLLIDDALHTQRLVFADNAVLNNAAMASDTDAVHYSHDVHVYVWDQRMPSRRGELRTPFATLLRDHMLLREAEDNQMHADYALSHPTMLLSTARQQDKADMRTLTEAELLTGDLLRRDLSGPNADLTATDRRTYERNVHESIQFEYKREQYNRAMNASVSSTRLDSGQSRVAHRGQTLGADRVLELPPGMDVARPPPVATIARVDLMRESYYDRLCGTLGVPRHFVEGLASQRNASEGAQRQSIESMRTTVMQDREQMASFFRFLWDRLYRANDNMLLSDSLAQVRVVGATIESRLRLQREKYDAVLELDAGDDASQRELLQRLEALEQQIEAIAALEHRVRLRFHKTVFLDERQLQELANVYAISPLEHANMLLLRHGLAEITEQEFEANRTVAQELEQEAMNDEQPMKRQRSKEAT